MKLFRSKTKSKEDTMSNQSSDSTLEEFLVAQERLLLKAHESLAALAYGLRQVSAPRDTDRGSEMDGDCVVSEFGRNLLLVARGNNNVLRGLLHELEDIRSRLRVSATEAVGDPANAC